MPGYLEMEFEENQQDDLVSSKETTKLVSKPMSSTDKLSSGLDIEATLIGSTACPCCNQRFGNHRYETLSQPSSICISPCRSIASSTSPGNGRVFEDRTIAGPCQTLAGSSTNDMHSADRDSLPGTLAHGHRYKPSRILVEGWLLKKGSGNDWLGSRGWKARWTRLCLARVDGFEHEVPLLLIYWFPVSEDPTTVIHLDRTVVLKVDKEDKSSWNTFRFEVRHVCKDGKETRATRTFAAPQIDRDSWVYAISDALLSYEKERYRIRQKRLAEALACRSDRSKSPTINDLWLGDRMVSPPVSPMKQDQKTSSSPTRNPRLPRSTAT